MRLPHIDQGPAEPHLERLLLTVIDARGNTSIYVYDQYGNRTRDIAVGDEDVPWDRIDPGE
jgi:YD repeat-containing protein